MKHNWEYKRLGDICEILDSLRKPVTKSDRVKGIYPYYGASGIQDYVDDYIFDGDYLLVGEDGAKWGSNEKSAFTISGKTWVNNHAHVLDFKNSIVSHRLVEYYICNLDLNTIVTGAVVPKLTQKNLVSISIPVPPMAVQEQIVAELDKINEVIADCRELLRNLDALAQSLFYDYFGDPITNPKGWEVKKLVDICKAISTGITYKPENVANTGTIVLRSSNIQNSAFVLNDIVRINMLLKPSQYVKKNDILMCSRNGSARLVGKVALIPEINENMSWGAFMTIIRSDFHHFLFQYFHLPAFRGQLTKTKTTTVNQITIGMLKQIQLPVPPLELQEKFAARIEQIEEQKKAVEQTIAELQTLLDSRMDYWFN